MSTKKKLLEAAAGNAGGEVSPVGIDFDGANDYLSRSSDLSGNTNGKTFTFSAWVYQNGPGNTRIYDTTFGSTGPNILFNFQDGSISCIAQNSSNSTILNMSKFGSSPENYLTWSHILISVDLANASNRKVYLNDKDITSSMTFDTYVNDTIAFAQPDHSIGANYNDSAGEFKGRLAGVYLDHTYRDLSVESNRRDFIDENGLYVTPPTSGIISVPMDDPTDPGKNNGTGGDFTLNGVVAQSNRGPQQYNSAASTFDGSADYLSLPNVSGMSNSKTLNVSFNFKMETPSTGNIFSLYNSGGVKTLEVRIDFFGGNWRLSLGGRSSSSEILFATIGLRDYPNNKWQNYSISLDMANTSNRLVYIDGVDYTSQVTWSTYSNAEFNLNGKSEVMRESSSYVGGELSDLWFNTSYIDLSSDNPFYDTETNKPKFLGESGELPTGSNPLIYLPLKASDAGNNLGTGGDFTVNSGPYTGARGPSEFWANGIQTNSNSAYVYKSLTAQSTFTIATAFNLGDGGNSPIHYSGQSGFYFESGQSLIRFYNGSSQVVQFSNSTNYTSGWHIVLLSVNLSTNTAYCYVDGVSMPITTNNMSSYSTADFTNLRMPYEANSKVGAFYMSSTFVDISQEANRLKFFDALGNPLDWGSEVTNENIDSPIVLLKFNNSSLFGSNSGTGGDFTATSNITDIGYVNG